MKNRTKLEKLLIEDEGIRLLPYEDSVGKLTIGIGRNLDDVGITREEALYLLSNDIYKTTTQMIKYPWFMKLSDNRQLVILSMVFNMGLPRFLGFKKTIGYLKEDNFKSAAEEMLDSKWARQVGRRAIKLSKMMLEG